MAPIVTELLEVAADSTLAWAVSRSSCWPQADSNKKTASEK
jgi:hypothetical protein